VKYIYSNRPIFLGGREMQGDKCLSCEGENIINGQQEMFPSVFMDEGGSILNVARIFRKAKEFDLYACADCGHTSWFIKEKYMVEE
jgi:hypothetical protein